MTVASGGPILEVANLRKTYGDKVVLADIDLVVSPSDVICLIGASGSGKSTLLRCLNLLEDIDDGVDRSSRARRSPTRAATGGRCAAGWAWSSRPTTSSRT